MKVAIKQNVFFSMNRLQRKLKDRDIKSTGSERKKKKLGLEQTPYRLLGFQQSDFLLQSPVLNLQLKKINERHYIHNRVNVCKPYSTHTHWATGNMVCCYARVPGEPFAT